MKNIRIMLLFVVCMRCGYYRGATFITLKYVYTVINYHVMIYFII